MCGISVLKGEDLIILQGRLLTPCLLPAVVAISLAVLVVARVQGVGLDRLCAAIIRIMN